MVNYTPVPDLIQIIENRECFQAVIPDDEIDRLIDAAELLVVRAKQELNSRLAAQPGSRFLSVARPYPCP
jgi:hypothetical protein